MLFYGCRFDKHIDLNDLKNEVCNYSSLPKEVKQNIFNASFIDLNKPARYIKETRKDKALGWIYHTEIHCINKDVIYNINLKGENGKRYVILNDMLFIPKHYNIYVKDSSNYYFTKFNLTD